MKKNLLSLLSLSLLVFSSLKALTIDRCGTSQYTANEEAQNPGLVQIRQQIEQQMLIYMALHANSPAPNTIVTVPVVAHILYANASENIADAKVIAQISQLNLDYSAMNSDTGSIPAVFKPYLANTHIQFCLATRDPNGNATTGIIHKSTTVASWSTNDAIKHNSSLGDDAWPAASYLNLWIGNLGGGLLGYAQFPGGSVANDGVVVHYGSVGSHLSPSTYNWNGANYNWGRTATHEIGHWFNLYHTFQGGCTNTNCLTQGDHVCDTPPVSTSNFSCPSFPHISCSGYPNGDMFMNYMDYVDDNCMMMFTDSQVIRATSAIAVYRNQLQNSLGCTPVGIFYPEAGLNASIYPNPATNELNIYLSLDKRTDVSITFSNPMGEEIYRDEILNSSEIKLAVDLSKFANGVYVLNLKTTEGTLSKKITIQH